MSERPVRVRFAPSPTGYLHVGGARTALFNWLFARRHGGQFILRIEDTDRNRFQPDALDDIVESLRWLGLDWDEGPLAGGTFGPYFQSERAELYQHYARQLVAAGQAYHCYCTPERLAALREEARERKGFTGYDRRCRELTAAQRAEREAAGAPRVVRLKAPLAGQTTFHDIIRGSITVDHSQLDDLVLLKSDGFPTYHLANVVDDHLMEITHIMRADEWLPSVPKHILLYTALGWEPPLMAHLPLILDPSGQGKLSKRKKRDGGEQRVLVREFRQAGYLPEALFNFLALVGWSLDDKTQIMSRETLVRHFDLDRVNKSPAAFSYEKLEWMNGHYIRELPAETLTEHMIPFLARGLGIEEGELRRRPETAQLAPLVRERMKVLPDALPFIDFFYREDAPPEPADLVPKKVTLEEALAALRAARGALAGVEPWDAPAIEAALRELPEKLGLKAGPVFGIVRAAATGKPVSPPLFETLVVLGKERTLRRLERAREILGELASSP